MSATRIFSLAAALALAVASPAPAVAAGSSVASPREAAFERGMAALRSGQIDAALPDLERAAADGVFLAQYYLARVFSDSSGSHTDHAKAYMLFRRIADEHADIDPDDDRRAPFVARALTALAGYVRGGIAEIGLEPDPERGAEYLRHSATFFNDPDAQFELAKMHLSGEGVPEDSKRAIHWLAVLTEEGHAGAQAFLADLYWRGRHVKADQVRALALVSIAAENAPATEQIWIEDVHQAIFCSAGEATRRQAAAVLADWRRKYGRPGGRRDDIGLAPLRFSAVRTCSNGERVVLARQGERVGPSAPPPAETPAVMMQGSVLGVGLRAPGAAPGN